MKLLHEILQEIAEGTSGKKLAEIIGKSEGYVTQIKAGAIPTEEILAILAAKLAPDRLPELFIAQCAARIKKLNIHDKNVEHLALEAVGALFAKSASNLNSIQKKLAGRSFNDFPDAFKPLCVVTGDKREDRGARITVADIGASSASPADTRWLLNLGLDKDVIKHVDKNFVLLSDEKLIERFAETNLFVIGSPAANHLARRINKKAVFRFNYSSHAGKAIEDEIKGAKGRSETDLTAIQESIKPGLSKRLRPLFTGGILDPTYPDDFLTAEYAQIVHSTQYDFGMLTFATNPFYEMKCQNEKRENDHRYVAIIAAGIHHPATAHAVRQLGIDKRKEGVFKNHPYGGVLRVTLNLTIPFSERVELATCIWEDIADEVRKPKDDQRAFLIEQLKTIDAKLKKGELKNLQLQPTDAEECLNLIERL